LRRDGLIADRLLLRRQLADDELDELVEGDVPAFIAVDTAAVRESIGVDAEGSVFLGLETDHPFPSDGDEPFEMLLICSYPEERIKDSGQIVELAELHVRLGVDHPMTGHHIEVELEVPANDLRSVDDLCRHGLGKLRPVGEDFAKSDMTFMVREIRMHGNA
jgi:hypothetical protein